MTRVKTQPKAMSKEEQIIIAWIAAEVLNYPEAQRYMVMLCDGPSGMGEVARALEAFFEE